MYRLFQPSVAAVTSAPVLVIFIDEEQSGWCQRASHENVIPFGSGNQLDLYQFSEEGYAIVQVARPRDTDDRNTIARETLREDTVFISNLLDATSRPPNLKACIHFSISYECLAALIPKTSAGQVLPTIIHLSTPQSSPEEAYAALLANSNNSQLLSANEHAPIMVHIYPSVPSGPPFPFRSKPPALVQAGESNSVDPYIRSAMNLSYSRTLALLRRELGPHFNLEKLWEKHTYYEFVERDAPKTMSTMVKVPYVNHVATLTGGVGYDDLARFYKHHFTGTNVTPPDTELIVVSRTVGADRIVDEMIFKATHTTEIDYFLPGIKPTGKPFQVALVAVIAFRGDKLTFEHIYWDQASVLVQLGLLDPSGLPVASVETAQKVLDPFAVPSNT